MSAMQAVQTTAEEILAYKKEKNVLILAHYYQNLEVQKIADFVGDSFELAKRAKAAVQETVVFCGVRFMAESAKILNPEKKVLLPVPHAGCPMADMIDAETVQAYRQKYPDAAVVCYVNSSAETKAVSDICCTSSNAVRVVKSLPQKRIVFVPDKNLGAYVAGFVPEKEIICHSGFCPIHKNITVPEAQKAMREHPNALLACHPECEAEVLELADFIGSTSEILKFARTSEHKEFIIGTERGVCDRLNEEEPDKHFYLLSPQLVCPNMKKTELSDVLHVLRTGENEIIMTEEEIRAAYAPLARMVEIP